MEKNHAKKIFIFCFIFFAHATAFAQYKLTIILNGIPASHQGDSLYVGGSFNNWQPGKTMLLYNANLGVWQAVIDSLNAEVYEFKFTRGSWSSVQAAASGGDVQNNLLKLSSDTTVAFGIAAWKDDFAAMLRQHTASLNVSILDTAFAMPQLQDTRRIWLYLPPGYKKSKEKYPVLYMNDGQNLFDEYTGLNGEWGVDECLDTMIANGKQACIVVGIDNGPKRMTEYNPYNNDRFGKGEGEAYVKFIAETLKPYIDKHYRTLRSKANTIIAGSSMGGLISYYAVLRYPEVFGKAGIFSPAFWTADPLIYNFTDSISSKINGRFFFYAGGSESDGMIPDIMKVMDLLGAKTSATIYSFTDEESRHNEQAWRKWFPIFYTWITQNGNDTIVPVE